MIRKSFIFTLFILCSNQIQAFAAIGEQYMRNPSTAMPNQYLVTLGCCHIELDQAIHQQQKTDLINQIQHLQTAYGENSVLVIAEDIKHFTKDAMANDEIRARLNEKKGKELLEGKKFIQFLDGLTFTCLQNKIPIENIEFRQTITSLSTALKNPDVLKEELPHVQAEYERFKKIILEYNDGTLLNEYYRLIIKEFDEKIQIIKGKSQSEHKDYQKLYEMYKDALNKCVDLKILHVLEKNKDKKFIFMCAGAAHIRDIQPVLQVLNFKKIATKVDRINQSNTRNFQEYVTSRSPEHEKNSIQAIEPINIEKFCCMLG